MEKIKIQHYVPRYYLKQFTKRSNESNLIECYDKLEDRQITTDIRNVASERFFYDKNIANPFRYSKLYKIVVYSY